MQTTTIPNLELNETGYQTAAGNYIAVSYSLPSDARKGYVGVVQKIRFVTSTGESVLDHTGAPMEMITNSSDRADNITDLNAAKLGWVEAVELILDHEVTAQQHFSALFPTT